jgi:phage portal protein BeeE
MGIFAHIKYRLSHILSYSISAIICKYSVFNVSKSILNNQREDIFMRSAEKLKNLLELEIIPDLEVAIDELFASIDKAKSASKEQKDDLEELRDMRTECFAIIEELKRDELEEDEIEELLAELVEMKTEE